jgi:hypothetical protein
MQKSHTSNFWPGWGAGVNSNRFLCAVSIVLLVVLTGCGAGGGYDAGSVTVTVSPVAATVAASGQVNLQAAVHGFCTGCMPQIVWSVAENFPNNCTWVDMNTPPAGPCPGGTMQGQGAEGPLSETVIYFAPSTAGTYHISASQFVTLSLTVQAASVITVSP